MNNVLEQALQQQISVESYSSSVYLAMASWMDSQGFEGTAAFLYRQSEEERMHMLKIFHFINDQDGFAKVPSINAPQNDFGDYQQLFNMVLEQEQAVTRSIHELVNLAVQEKDHATHSFLQWYITEQMEEEKQVKTILNKLKIIGNDRSGLYLIDKELEALSQTPITAEEK